MKPTLFFLTALVACLAGAARADSPPPMLTVVPATIRSPLPPYSAKEESVREQVLHDGNVIAMKSVSAHYRDSAGRTRRETRSSFTGDLMFITINTNDGYSYTLEPSTKIAKRANVALNAQLARAATAADATVTPVNNGGKPIIITTVSSVSNANTTSQASKIAADAFSIKKTVREVIRKSLGTREIDGVTATGTLMSYVIPAGEQGNRDPMTMATETWTSEELRITVYSKTTDPRSGDLTRRLTELQRGEPDPSLFVVPSDYTIVDQAPLQINR